MDDVSEVKNMCALTNVNTLSRQMTCFCPCLASFCLVSREFLSRVSRVGQESARAVIIEKVNHAQHLLVERSLRQLQILDIEFYYKNLYRYPKIHFIYTPKGFFDIIYFNICAIMNHSRHCYTSYT
jgi:hypothetical protein